MSASALRIAWVAAALAVILVAPALAQTSQPRIAPPGSAAAPAPTDGPPVAVGPDWQYERRPNDIYMFHCRAPRCTPPSRVSYRLYAPNSALSLAQFRQEQEAVIKALQERAPPGTQIKVLEIKGDEGSGPRRMFVSRRLVSYPDGTQEYTNSAVLLGSKYSASLISSANAEKAAQDNQAIFALALMVLINVEAKPKK